MKALIIFSIEICILLSACGNDKSAGNVVNNPPLISQKSQSIPLKAGLRNAIELFRGSKAPVIEMQGSYGDTVVYCSNKGKLELSDTLHTERKMILDLRAEYMVNKVFVVPLKEKKWFLVWEETNMDGLRSYAAVFTTGSSKPEWKVTFNNPNPGSPVVDGNATYISTLGMVAKISLVDGALLWKDDSLFNQAKFSFQKFDKPLVYREEIIFVDFPISGRREYRDSLFLDPLTGKRKK